MTRRELMMGAAAFSAMTDEGSAAQPLRLLVAGQSLARAWEDKRIQHPFRLAFGRPVRVTVAAEGGTAVLPTRPRHWTNKGQVGPVLAAALAEIGTSQFDAILWAQGQADADDWSKREVDPQTFVNRFQSATRFVIEALRDKQTKPVPVYIQTLGWTAGGVDKDSGWTFVRHAQVEMVALHADLGYRLGPVQGPWTELVDRVHPTLASYQSLANEFGHALKRDMP